MKELANRVSMNSIGGYEVSGFLRNIPTRKDGEILVPARLTAKCWDVQKTPQEAQRARDMIGGDPHQLQVSADRAMSVEGIAKRHHASVEAALAVMATPWIHAQKADNNVCDAAPPGPSSS
jgi:hypothetical protein